MFLLEVVEFLLELLDFGEVFIDVYPEVFRLAGVGGVLAGRQVFSCQLVVAEVVSLPFSGICPVDDQSCPDEKTIDQMIAERTSRGGSRGRSENRSGRTVGAGGASL